MLSYDKNKTIQHNIYVCSHKSKCKMNMYGQCVYNFNLRCKNCKYGLKSIYDKCKNNECSLYLQKIINVDLENDFFEEDIFKESILEEDFLEEEFLKEDFLEEKFFEEDISDGDISQENIEEKTHEYFHYGDCIFNEYGQCKKGWRYFCSCGYGIKGYYGKCKTKKCLNKQV